MTTAATKAIGTFFQIGDGATPELFSTLAEIRDIDPPEAVSKTADVTSHDSTKAEYINAYVDEGELTLSGNWVGDAAHLAAVAACGGVAGNFRLCFQDFGQSSAAFTAAADDIITSNGHGYVTGQPFTFTTSASDPPDGLAVGTVYYVRYVSDDTFTLHTTNAGAVANTGKVNIVDAGSGTHTSSMGTRLDFAGLWTSAQLSAPLDGAQGIVLKVKITGDVTWNT